MAAYWIQVELESSSPGPELESSLLDYRLRFLEKQRGALLSKSAIQMTSTDQIGIFCKHNVWLPGE